MKKVIMDFSADLIRIADLNDDHYIGVRFTSGRVGHVVKIDSNTYMISNLSLNSSYSTKITGLTIADLLRKTHGLEEVYVLSLSELKDFIFSGKNV
jgi:hypothetical protein